ncbi:Sec8 exocyst complex component-specific domain-containing protein [Chytriomyces cf. hyalinus JEL632]|nr:Sec8 exocyst complex component-specific domain-containing protein [Chytriomyces cf. hyalinus JEL632]
MPPGDSVKERDDAQNNAAANNSLKPVSEDELADTKLGKFSGQQSNESDTSLPKEVTSVMDAVRVIWDFMSNINLNPVPHALSLLDSTANGLDIKKFYAMHERLEAVMGIIVNDYHQAFNDSIQTFSTVMENISDSQKRVSEMKSELEWCKELLQSKKFDIFPLWVKSIQCKKMISILETIETLQGVPDKIESLISGKYFYLAVTCLMDSLATLSSSEYVDIGALLNIRSHLEEVKKNFHETLIDELNSHIYLKSSHSLDRIKVQVSDVDAAAAEYAYRSSDARLANSSNTSPHSTKTNAHAFHEDLDLNPEQDSFHYMSIIVECLHIIGRLPEAVEILKDMLSVEFFYTAERTIQETDQQKSHRYGEKSGSSRAQDLIGLSERIEDAYVLRDLLCCLFEKMECIIVAHRYVHELRENRIGEYVHPVEFWSTVQNEVKSLLYNYLTRTSLTTDFESAIVSMNDVLKEKRSYKGKDQGKKQLFKLSTAPNAEMTAAYMKLRGVQEPQTFSNATIAVTDEHSLSSAGIVDKYANAVTAGHRLLISPDLYNVLIAFKPTMNFVQKIECMISHQLSSICNWLDHLRMTSPSLPCRLILESCRDPRFSHLFALRNPVRGVASVFDAARPQKSGTQMMKQSPLLFAHSGTTPSCMALSPKHTTR